MDTIELEVAVDISDIQALADVTYTVVDTLGDKRTRNKIVHSVARRGRETFGLYMDALAQENYSSYHHVYEWDRVGDANGRLFKVTLTPAAEGSTTARVEFTQARRPNRERRLVGETIDVIIIHDDGTKTKRPMKVFPRQREHIFRDKASVFENGATVQVEAEDADMLFWIHPTKDLGFMAAEMEIDHSEGDTVNRFSSAWNLFWSEEVEPLIMEPLTKDMEKALYPAMESAMQEEGSGDFVAPGKGTRMTNKGKRHAGGIKPKKSQQASRKSHDAVNKGTRHG